MKYFNFYQINIALSKDMLNTYGIRIQIRINAALIILFYLVGFSGQAQRKVDKTISLNTQTGKISDADKLKIPFDEAFYITGTFSKREVSSVGLRYKIRGYCRKENSIDEDNESTQAKDSSLNQTGHPKSNQVVEKIEDDSNGESLNQEIQKNKIEKNDDEKDKNPTNCKNYERKKHYYILENHFPLDSEGYITLPTVKVDQNNSFEILMDAMHDNEIYILEFTFFEKVPVDEKIQKALKSEILLEINNTYNPKRNKIGNKDFQELNRNLEKIVSKKFKSSRLFDKSNQPIDLKKQIGSNEEITSAYKKARTKNNDNYVIFEKLKYKSNIDGFSIEKLMKSLDENRNVLSKAITRVLKDKNLNARLRKPVNSIVDEKTTLENVLSFVSEDLNRWSDLSLFTDPDKYVTDSYILEILMGRGRLVGNIINSNGSKHHLISGQLLLSAFIQLQNLKFQNDSSVIEKDSLKDVVLNLEKWCLNISDFDQNTSGLNNLANQFGDIYSEVYTKFKLALPVSTIENIETKESNYLGLDVGLMIAPDIGSTFFFEGVNFHAQPVNRRAGFSELKYSDSVWKRLSFFLGVAQRIGGDDDDGYEKLIGIGSPFVGAGWRFHKGFRLNAGAMWYKVQDQHPLINETSVEATVFLSLSIDASFKDIIKTITGIN